MCPWKWQNVSSKVYCKCQINLPKNYFDAFGHILSLLKSKLSNINQNIIHLLADTITLLSSSWCLRYVQHRWRQPYKKVTVLLNADEMLSSKMSVLNWWTFDKKNSYRLNLYTEFHILGLKIPNSTERPKCENSTHFPRPWRHEERASNASWDAAADLWSWNFVCI